MSAFTYPGPVGNAHYFNTRLAAVSGKIECDDLSVDADASAAALSFYLPDANNDGRGRVVFVKKIDATGNTVTLVPANALSTIEGATSFVLSVPNSGVFLQATDSGIWRIIGQVGSVTASSNGNASVQTARATFDPSGNTAHRTVGAHGLGVFLPVKALITRMWYDVGTTFTSATDAGTVALKAESANDLLSAIAISDATNVLDAGIHAGKPGYPNFGADAAHDSQVEVAALFAATVVKTTQARELTATVAVEALTAGKAVLFVEYVIGA
jgi:hypothetical protein